MSADIHTEKQSAMVNSAQCLQIYIQRSSQPWQTLLNVCRYTYSEAVNHGKLCSMSADIHTEKQSTMANSAQCLQIYIQRSSQLWQTLINVCRYTYSEAVSYGKLCSMSGDIHIEKQSALVNPAQCLETHTQRHTSCSIT